MALKATVETKFGETRELYFRINHLPSIPYDGVTDVEVLIRGYIGSFENGKQYMWSSDEVDDPNGVLPHMYLTFPQSDIDLNGNLREQIYTILKGDDRLNHYLSNIEDA